MCGFLAEALAAFRHAHHHGDTPGEPRENCKRGWGGRGGFVVTQHSRVYTPTRNQPRLLFQSRTNKVGRATATQSSRVRRSLNTNSGRYDALHKSSGYIRRCNARFLIMRESCPGEASRSRGHFSPLDAEKGGAINAPARRLVIQSLRCKAGHIRAFSWRTRSPWRPRSGRRGPH